MPKTTATKADTASTPVKKASGALGKPVKPSAKLAAIVGAEPLPRTEVVSKIWDHIRSNNLQDPADKRTIVADDKLRAIFGKDRATMFEMQKLLSPHLTAA